jgi:hypothetical protein
MTKSAADFAERNTERAVQATNYGMDWVREVAGQNFDQSKASVEALVIATRKTVDALDQQTSAILGRSMSAAEETLSNTFDFLHKLVRMKDSQELALLQGEFVSRKLKCSLTKPKSLGRRSCKVPARLQRLQSEPQRPFVSDLKRHDREASFQKHADKPREENASTNGKERRRPIMATKRKAGGR